MASPFSLSQFLPSGVSLEQPGQRRFVGWRLVGWRLAATLGAGLGAMSATWSGTLLAEEATQPAAPPAIQFQEGEDPVERLTPTQPRTAEAANQVQARAWFATGRVLEANNDHQAAYNAYKKAVELDPRALPVYRALIQLGVSLNQVDEAIKYATKAVELDPSDFQLLRRLGLHQLNSGDLLGATKFFEQASQSEALSKNTALYVTTMRDLALLYEEVGRPEDSARAYEVVFDALRTPEKYQLDFANRAKLLGDPAVTYEKMGQAFVGVKKYELALAAFQKAGETKKGKTGAYSYNMATTYLDMGDAEKALVELQTYFTEQRQSKGRDAYELLAKILEKLGKSNELVERLEKIAEEDARNTALQYYLADQYRLAGMLDKAEPLYKKMLASDPDAAGFAGLAAVYRRLAKTDELLDTLAKGFAQEGDIKAIDAEIKFLATDPKVVDTLVDSGRKLKAEGAEKLGFEQAYVLANLAAEARREEPAVEFYRHILDTRDDKADDALRELGGFYIDLKKYADAAKVFQEAATNRNLTDQRPNFLYMLSQAQELAGDTKGALETIATARQNTDHPLLAVQEGWIYYHSKQFDEAIARFEKVVSTYTQPQFRPTVNRARSILSTIYVQRGEQRKGEEILEEMLKESPNDPTLNNDLGYLYADQGRNLEQAERMIRKAIKAEPENAAFLDSLGWVLFKLGKLDEALPMLEKSVEKAKGNGDDTIWDHLGDAYEKAGQHDKALAAWKSALKSAQSATQPDTKLVNRLEEKIKTREAGTK
jgi:tetratricopeptide (TPR) repeat protein